MSYNESKIYYNDELWKSFMPLEIEPFNKSLKKFLKQAGFTDIKFNDIFTSLDDGFPKVEISETKDTYILKYLVPGIDKENIKINLENESLSISINKLEAPTDENLLYTEIKRSSQIRTVKLGENIDKSEIKASLDKGILTVKLKKIKEGDIKKSMEIKIT